jgi:hypothetical protein
MPGSSFFRIIRKQNVFSITGPTGPTGTTGPTGPDGYGPTGPTGLGISGMSMIGFSLRTQFDDLSTHTVTEALEGPIGNTITPIKVNAPGAGVNIVSSQPSVNEIFFRSIKGKTSTTGKTEIKITDIGNTLTMEYISNTDGYTLVNLGIDALSGFVGTTGTGFSLTNIRTSNYIPSNGSGIMKVKNVIEKARGLGYTGATHYLSGITCNYVYNDLIEGYFPCKTVKIDPSCISNNSVDYGTTNKTYVVDMENKLAKIIIGRPTSASLSSAFTLVIKNALNSSIGYEKKFQSPFNSISWPFGVEPCFGGTGETDVYHFYNLFDSWFGSVVYSSKYEGKTFTCERSDNLNFGACCEKYFTGNTCGITCSVKPQFMCDGINQIFKGVGSTCGTSTCSVTGPCCVRVGCNTAFETVVQCFDGITFENCICGNFNTDLGDCVHPPTPTESSGVEFIFHDGYTACLQIDNCTLTTCPGLGSCCTGGSCLDNDGLGIKREDCLALNGRFIEGELCDALGTDYCSYGRCCKINFTNLNNSTCEINIKADCFSTSSNIGVTWMAGGNCTDNKCLYVGGCCTGGDCLYPTYELPTGFGSFYSSIIGPSSQNPICVRGLCGLFMGDSVFCNDGTFTCDDPVSSAQTGTCVRLICPDGSPITSQTTLAQCKNYPNSRFYASILPTATGKCCSRIVIDGTPIENYCFNTTLQDCMETGGYAGGGWRCTSENTEYETAFFPSQQCSTSVPCTYPDASVTQSSSVSSIYVGDYYPKGSNLLGKNFKLCCPVTFDDLMKGTSTEAKPYDSKFDWAGYGVTFAANNDSVAQGIKFKVYVYNKDLSYTDSDGNDVTIVPWGQTGGNQAWGPHVQYNSSIYEIKDLQGTNAYNYYSTLKEGYWVQVDGSGVTLTTPDVLKNNTYDKQFEYDLLNSISVLTDVSKACVSNNGSWRRNWGLYNTMRMFGADNAFYALNMSDYTVSSEWTASRLVDKLNRQVPVNSNSSSWFIPSLDEMAFICSKLSSIYDLFDDNLLGEYWTSTGSFDYDNDKTEGKQYLNTNTIKSGTVAWSFEIIQGSQVGSFTINTKKTSRNSKLKVRPIRIEIEDTSLIPAVGTERYKLWRLQPLKWVTDNLG